MKKLVDGEVVDFSEEDVAQRESDISDATALEQAAEMSRYEAAIQSYLDATARELGYDSIHTAVTYAEEPAVEKFQLEGQALRAWRSLVWGFVYEQLDLVMSGQREKPTVVELISEMPRYGAE